jgi:hypothetical protein
MAYAVTHALKYLPDRTDWIHILIAGGHLHFRSVGNTGASEVVVPITKLGWGQYGSESNGSHSIAMSHNDPDTEITTDFRFRMGIGAAGSAAWTPNHGGSAHGTLDYNKPLRAGDHPFMEDMWYKGDELNAACSNALANLNWIGAHTDRRPLSGTGLGSTFEMFIAPPSMSTPASFAILPLYIQLSDAVAAQAASAFSNGALDLSAVTLATPADHDAKLASLHDLFVATAAARFRVASGLARTKLAIESSKAHIDVVKPKAYANQPANIAAIKVELLAEAAAELDVTAMSYCPLDAQNPAVVLRYPNGVDVYVLRESSSQYSLRVEKDSAPVSCTRGDGTVEGDGEWTVSSVTDQTVEIFSVDGAGWAHGDQLSVSFGSVAVAPYSEATLGDANIGYSSLRVPSVVAQMGSTSARQIQAQRIVFANDPTGAQTADTGAKLFIQAGSEYSEAIGMYRAGDGANKIQLSGDVTVTGQVNFAGGTTATGSNAFDQIVVTQTSTLTGDVACGAALSVTGATTLAAVTASGTVQAANFETTGAVTAASVTATGAINAASAAFANGVGCATVTATGDIQAANFTTAGAVDCATLAVSGDASITGNLVVAGTTTTINSTELMVRDRDICIGSAGDASQTEGAARDAITLAASGPHATDQSYISTQFGCFKDSAAGGADTPIGELRYNLGASKAADYFTTSARLECDTRVDAPELRAGQTLRLNGPGTGYVTLGLTAGGVLGFYYHASEGAVGQEMHSMQAI